MNYCGKRELEKKPNKTGSPYIKAELDVTCYEGVSCADRPHSEDGGIVCLLWEEPVESDGYFPISRFGMIVKEGGTVFTDDGTHYRVANGKLTEYDPKQQLAMEL